MRRLMVECGSFPGEMLKHCFLTFLVYTLVVMETPEVAPGGNDANYARINISVKKEVISLYSNKAGSIVE